MPERHGPVGVEEVDERLVEEVARLVRALSVDGTLGTAEVVGEAVLEAFYGGDIGLYSAIGREHASVQALVRHEALGRPGSVVWNALGYLEQKPLLPLRLVRGLTYAQHRALFRVRDAGLKRRLAMMAVRSGWSAKELAAEVQEALGEDPVGRGRPPAHPTLAAVKKIGKAMKALDAKTLSADELGDLSPRRRAAAAEACERHAERLLEAARRLRGRG